MVLKEYLDKYNGDGGKSTPLERQKQAYSFFVNKGYTPEQSAGIVGNMIQESGADLKTHVKGFDGTGSTGIVQWLGSRLDKLKEVQGDKWNTFQGQLEFVDWELKNTEKKAAEKLSNASTAEEAALMFSKYYERPHKDYAHNEKRQNYANNVINNFKTQDVPKKESVLNKVTKPTTQDTLDPNNYIVDIIGDQLQVSKPQKTQQPDFSQLEEMFKSEQAKQNNKKQFQERLKELYIKEEPQQVVDNSNYQTQQINDLYSDELYNYIQNGG